MEFKITDLLNDIQDISLDIHHCTVVSENRVKELTMKKLRKEQPNTQPPRPSRWTAKAALIAAVLACLSITVLAAAGIQLDQQLSTQPEETVGYDNDIYIGSVSKNWDLGGWLVELKAEAASASGLTMVCMEWGGQAQTGTLTTDDAFWLEVWNGSGYELYPAKNGTGSSGSTTVIQANATVSWPISWTESHGQLPPGNYRLGKSFWHTPNSGEIQHMACYVKFRVFEPDDAFIYSQYETALQALCNEDSWHLTWQVFPETPNGYTSYSREIWKSGENFLENLCYLDADGTLLRHSGTALYGGIGYDLTWVNGKPDTELAQCKPDDSVQAGRFIQWHTFLVLSDARISEISKDGSRIIFRESPEAPSGADWETVLTLSGDGKIQSIQEYRFSAGERILYSTLTVHDTAPAEIAQLIADQGLSTTQ